MNVKMLVAAVAAAVALPVLAQAPAPATPRIDQRQINQERRIEQGERSGQLTTREAGRLEQGQAHVARMEGKAKADGAVSRQERMRIQHAQKVQSRKIYRQKHDRQHDLNHDGRVDRPAK